MLMVFFCLGGGYFAALIIITVLTIRKSSRMTIITYSLTSLLLICLQGGIWHLLSGLNYSRSYSNREDHSVLYITIASFIICLVWGVVLLIVKKPAGKSG